TLIGRNAGPLAVLESGWAHACPALAHLAARARPAAWCRRRIRLTVPLIALAMAFALLGGNEGGTGRQECPDAKACQQPGHATSLRSCTEFPKKFIELVAVHDDLPARYVGTPGPERPTSPAYA